MSTNYIPIPTNLHTRADIIRLRIKEGMAGYGTYIAILSVLRDEEGYTIEGDALTMAYTIGERDTDMVSRVLSDYNLFRFDDGRISSPWLMGAMQPLDNKRAQARAAGKASAYARTGVDGKVAAQRPSNDRSTTVEGQTNTSSARDYPPTHVGVCVDNIQSNTNTNTNTQRPVQRPTSCSWHDVVDSAGKVWDGVYLDEISRERGDGRHDEVMARLEQDKTRDSNTRLLRDWAEYYNLTDRQVDFVWAITDKMTPGDPNLMEILQQYKRAKKDDERPKYPLNFIVKKLSSYNKN